MTDKDIKPRKLDWLSLAVTTIVGIAATVGVGWYQLSQAEKQAILAEEERLGQSGRPSCQ